MKFIFYLVAILFMVVTCSNVQALRDTYAPEPSPIERTVVSILEGIGDTNDSN